MSKYFENYTKFLAYFFFYLINFVGKKDQFEELARNYLNIYVSSKLKV